MTINELIERAHTQAKAMGWWDEERNMGELLMLIVSECGEALEAHRSGRRFNNAEYMTGIAMYAEDNKKLGFGAEWPLMAAFDRYIKDTFEDELADIVIRIADLLGDVGYVCKHEPNDMRRDGNVGEALLYVTKMVGEDNPKFLCGAMMEVFGIAKAHNIDLWRHIELKLAYNRTRPKKHGKAY